MLFYVSKTSKVMTDQNLTFTEKAAAAEPYSLMRAIKQKLKGQEPKGIYKEMNERGIAEYPSPYVPKSDTIYIPVQNTDNILLPTLRSTSVLTRAGATITVGLKFGIPPSFPAFTSGWGTVNDNVTDASEGFKDFHPHYLVSQICVPTQLFAHDVLAFEPILRESLAKSIAQALEGAVLGNGQADNKKPDGLFHDVTNTVEMSWYEIGKLETAMDAANALDRNCSYVMHTHLYSAAKVISQTDDSPIFLFNGRDIYINGYPVLRSNNVYADTDNGKYGILFGSFEDLFIWRWGPLELVVRCYPFSDNVSISVNSYWDAGLCRDGVMSKALFTIPSGKPVA
jgi:HK97 family phage major capsid protein